MKYLQLPYRQFSLRLISIIAFSIGLIIISCGQKSVSDSKPLLNHFTEEDVARYTISAIMSQSPEIISAKKEDEIFRVSYVRKRDAKKFDYKVKLDGYKVVWGNFDGRWRDDYEDGMISFVENGDSLRIIQAYEGDSAVYNDFHKQH